CHSDGVPAVFDDMRAIETLSSPQDMLLIRKKYSCEVEMRHHRGLPQLQKKCLVRLPRFSQADFHVASLINPSIQTNNKSLRAISRSWPARCGKSRSAHRPKAW